MRRAGLLLAAGSLLMLIFTGCQFMPFGNANSAQNLATLASSITDYRNDSAVASSSKLDASDLQGKGIVISKSLNETTRQITRDDGTVVTIVEVTDDKDTATTEDDSLTVTRTYDIWSGAERTDKIIRPKKPKADWAAWNGDLYVQDGIQITSFINGVKVSEGTMSITWRKSGTQVSLAEIVKETHRIGRDGAIVKVDTVIDENGLWTKTKYRIKVTSSGNLVVHKFTYEEFTGADGQVYTKIVRDDGSYAVIVQKKNPRITEYYNADGILKVKVTETRDKSTGDLSVVKEIYDADGNLVATKNVSFQYKFLGDEVVVTKTFDNGKQVTMTIQESDEGFTVNRNGFVYNIKFNAGNVAIYDQDSNLIATVTFNADGSWTVIYADSSKGSVTVNP
ncbi:MAG: hypothetical protein GXP33_08600 [Spirochaetes bacterium]|nr:hypothetical protein [Spirochaetota bacterium]